MLTCCHNTSVILLFLPYGTPLHPFNCIVIYLLDADERIIMCHNNTLLKFHRYSTEFNAVCIQNTCDTLSQEPNLNQVLKLLQPPGVNDRNNATKHVHTHRVLCFFSFYSFCGTELVICKDAKAMDQHQFRSRVPETAEQGWAIWPKCHNMRFFVYRSLFFQFVCK